MSPRPQRAAPVDGMTSSVDAAELYARIDVERYDLHARYLNEQMVRVLRTIGYNVGFCRGAGQYLYDRSGTRYLDP
jgi:ornithine--oxo-acid transaminase